MSLPPSISITDHEQFARDLELFQAFCENESYPQVRNCIGEQFRKMLNEGWHYEDALRYVACTEEVNPDMDEDEALDEMTRIRGKYADGAVPSLLDPEG